MPYQNVPEELWGKMDSCVDQVQQEQKGISKESAIAICYDSIVGGKSYVDALKAHSERLKNDALAIKVGARHSKDDMVDMQTIHDLAVKQGAQCGDHEEMDEHDDEQDTGEETKHAKDLLITFGDAVKAIAIKDGRFAEIGGYLVRWGSPKEKDIEGEYFTKNTYLGAHDGNGMDTFINHGVPFMKGADELFDEHMNPVETKRDQIGLFAKTVLDLHNKFQKVLYELSERGALKWSSGTALNLVRKKQDGRITQWPIVDASLTPVPAEWRPSNRVLPLKSFIKEFENFSAKDFLSGFAEATAREAVREIPEDLKREAQLLKVKVGAAS